MARAEGFVLANPAYFQGSAVDGQAPGEHGQRGPERKIAADAQHDGSSWGGESGVGPVDKTGKGGEKVGFGAVFRRNGVLRWESERENEKCKHCACREGGPGACAR